MYISISNQDPRPLYEQIYESIKSEILKGGLKAGDALPSIRQLAQDLKISVITIKRAYLELEQDKLIISRPGKGCFVADCDIKEITSLNLLEIERQFREVVIKAKKTGVSRQKVEQIFNKVLEEEY